jgi:hypothetical protein
LALLSEQIMSNKNPLLVPIQAYAMVVNNQEQNFRRWPMNYSVSQYFVDPEADPFSSNQNDFLFTANDQPNLQSQGVYLQWKLPDGLRHGSQNQDGVIEFPLVPNRWLVIRYMTSPASSSTRTATAWLIESDALGFSDGVPLIDPNAPYAVNTTTYAPICTQTLVGHKFSLASQTWQETHNAMFLQAVAAANPMFASYQPHVQNIFSMQDDLSEQNVLSGTLSYMVIGWYSDGTADPLSKLQAQGKTYAEALEELQWFVEGNDTDTADSTLYQGMVLGVSWDKTGALPPSDKDNLTPSVAVGNTSIDAFIAWLQVNQAAIEQASPGVDTQWLEALLHNAQDAFNQPDSAAVLEQRVHEAWFSGVSGGTQWDLVSSNIAIDEALPPPLSTAEKNWLNTLNQNQQALDSARFQLSALRQKLYEMWWKNGYGYGYSTMFGKYPYNFSQADFINQLTQNNSTSLVSQVCNALQQVQQLETLVPTPGAGQSVADAIEAFTQAAIDNNEIQASRQLKALAKPLFRQATDPVLLINGVNHDLNIDPYASLPCRFADQLVTAIQLNYQGTTMLTASLAQSHLPACQGLTNVTAAINALLTDKNLVPSGNLLQALLDEFFLLDPANANIVAGVLHLSGTQNIQNIANIMAGIKSLYYSELEDNQAQTVVEGRLPAVYEPQWLKQPWLPLFIEWEVYWYAIPFQTNGVPNWQFNGRYYELIKVPDPLPQPQVLSGRSIMTPKTAFDMKSRIEQYISNNPYDETVADLEAAIEGINGWDFLSQTLTGFSEQLALRNPASNLMPDDSLRLFSVGSGGQTVYYTMAGLLGDEHHSMPQSSQVLYEEGKPVPVSTFEAMRNGQFFFRRITLVDQFGQTLEVVRSQSSDSFNPVLSPAVIPDKPVTAIEPYRLVQLPPRLLQPSRLNFTYVLPADDTQEVFLNSDENPICGWLLPNHLDRGLSIYAPDGTSLGELRPATDTGGTKILTWQNTPGSSYNSPSEIETDYPHLGNFLSALESQSYDEFVKFLAVIDETLWSVDPLGERYDQNLSVLVGRPLALVRAKLQFELQQEPLWDTAWPYTFQPPTPPFVNYEFPIKVGDAAHFKDGLLGYFSGDSFEVFHAVYDPNLTPSSFIQQIQPGQFINLKFDGASKAFLTVIVDPRASVYAQTDILPAQEAVIDQRYVQAALNRMAISFRVGPQLTTISTALSDDETPQSINVVLMPAPAESNGVWSWQERSGQDWTEMRISSAGQQADLSSVAPTLREGLLKLTITLTEENS